MSSSYESLRNKIELEQTLEVLFLTDWPGQKDHQLVKVTESWKFLGRTLGPVMVSAPGPGHRFFPVDHALLTGSDVHSPLHDGKLRVAKSWPRSENILRKKNEKQHCMSLSKVWFRIIKGENRRGRILIMLHPQNSLVSFFFLFFYDPLLEYLFYVASYRLTYISIFPNETSRHFCRDRECWKCLKCVWCC